MSPTPSSSLSLIAVIALLITLACVALGIFMLWRREFRFSLAGLLLFVLGAALICGGFAYHFRTVSKLLDQIALERELALTAMETAEQERARAEEFRAQQQAN
jgi:TRAP-type C4-dicarboxylate transport system permease small subunit